MSMVENIRNDAKKARWIGILLLIAGILSLLTPFAAGLSVTLIIGALMLASGIAQLFLVFGAGSIGKGLMLALLAVTTVIAGGYMLMQPLSALATLTLFLAGYFIAAGIVESIGAFGARPAEGWGWLLFGGIVSFALGAMLWSQFPLSGVWAVGTLIGVRLMMSGWMLIAIGGVAKTATESALGS